MNLEIIPIVVGILFVAWVIWKFFYVLPKRLVKLEQSGTDGDFVKAQKLRVAIAMVRRSPGIYFLVFVFVAYIIWFIVKAIFKY